mmetsp:Transcript_6128/g.11622  ORF Transcript_6128/g.11622 Transcript_6128/m.11622 type:complete len:551 (+) Transcript_6128:489-2141(+)
MSSFEKESLSYTSQQIVLATLPKFTSTLSILGSAYILQYILRHPQKRKTVFSRLMVALSTSDVVASICFFLGTWPVPVGTVGAYGAVGTTQTCTTQGFFGQAAYMCTPLYNGVLSLYYLLVIRYRWREDELKRIEVYLLVVPPLVAGGIAIAGLVLQLYNFANFICWIAPLPWGCLDTARYGAEDANCVRGDNAWIYQWAFLYGPVWFLILFMAVAMLLVYNTVLSHEKRAGRWSFSRRISGAAKQQQRRRRRSTAATAATAAAAAAAGGGGTSGSTAAAAAAASSAVVPPASEVTSSTTDASRPSTSALLPSFRFSAASLRPSCLSDEAATTAPSSNRLKHSRKVANQGMLYVLAFLLTWFWGTVTRILDLAKNRTYFPIVVLHVFFLPCQGFFNALVYLRPRYVRYVKDHPDRTATAIMRRNFRRTVSSLWSIGGGDGTAAEQDEGDYDGEVEEDVQDSAAFVDDDLCALPPSPRKASSDATGTGTSTKRHGTSKAVIKEKNSDLNLANSQKHQISMDSFNENEEMEMELEGKEEEEEKEETAPRIHP